MSLAKFHDAMGGSFDLHYAARTSIDQRSSAVIEQLARLSKMLLITPESDKSINLKQQQGGNSKVSPSRALPSMRSTSVSGDENEDPWRNSSIRESALSPQQRLPSTEISLIRHKEEITLLEAQLQQLRVMSQDKDERLAAAKQQLQQVQEATAAFFATSAGTTSPLRGQRRSVSSSPAGSAVSPATSPMGSILEQGKQYLRHEETIRVLENSILETQHNLERLSHQLAVDDSEYAVLEKRKAAAIAELAASNAASGALDQRLAALQQEAAECESQRLTLQQELDVLLGNASEAASLAPLERRKRQLESELQEIDDETQQLRAADTNLQQSIANGGGFTLEFANLSMEVTTSLRRLHRVRECMMLLKAFLINLCDDLDTIAETVQAIKDDPNFTAYSPFTEQSNAWRRQLLSAAYGDVVALIRTQQYLTDASAAAALLAKLKYFVIVYDLFNNHFDAVVEAVMAVEGPGKSEDAMWATVLDMQNIADQCSNTISENRKLQARRRSSVVALTSRRSTISLK